MVLECFFFNDTATTEIYTLSLHDALPICLALIVFNIDLPGQDMGITQGPLEVISLITTLIGIRPCQMGTAAQIVGKGWWCSQVGAAERIGAKFVTLPMGHDDRLPWVEDRKSTRLNSSHVVISYAVFCLKKKTQKPYSQPP